jgi:UDPglucose 6-dehydrogenase
MKLTIIGTGYVGLVTGACLAEVGNDVLCVDLDEEKINTLRDGRIPIHEPGLQELVQRNVQAGRLRFTTDIETSVKHGTLQFIAVGTPPDEDGSADLKHVIAAARNIGRYMTDYKVVINKSTVPVGTADRVRKALVDELDARNIEVPYSVVSNPEFLKEGSAIDDFMRPDRIVVGTEDEQANYLMRALYAPFVRNHDRMIMTDTRSSELIKYAANAMLATRISFMNELANLAEKIGADIEMVRQGMGSDPRIGYHFLYAGCGYGGSCFPKDVKALINTASTDAGVKLQILSAVENVNNTQKHILSKKLLQRFGSLNGRHIAIWGLAFKPNTDDMREAPSRELIADLFEGGATACVYDPIAAKEAKRIFGDEPRLSYASHAMDALANADALVIVTEWREFRSLDFAVIKNTLKQPVIFDGRNLYDPKVVRGHGIEYYAIGRS